MARVYVYFVSHTRTMMGEAIPGDIRPREENCEMWVPERVTSIRELLHIEELLEAEDARQREEEGLSGYCYVKILFYTLLRDFSLDNSSGESFQPVVKIAG